MKNKSQDMMNMMFEVAESISAFLPVDTDTEADTERKKNALMNVSEAGKTMKGLADSMIDMARLQLDANKMKVENLMKTNEIPRLLGGEE